jgi:hypothetical protein
MKIQLEAGVTTQKYSSGNFVGVWLPDTPKHYRFGNYEFSNVYSANMFSYLFRHDSPKLAQQAVVAFETKLTGSDAKKTAFKTIASTIDWKTAATGNVPAALIGTLKNAVSTACDLALGVAVRTALVSTSGIYNPYPAEKSAILWVGSSARDQYIEYAIGYWKKFAQNGPAYKSSAETV